MKESKQINKYVCKLVINTKESKEVSMYVCK